MTNPKNAYEIATYDPIDGRVRAEVLCNGELVVCLHAETPALAEQEARRWTAANLDRLEGEPFYQERQNRLVRALDLAAA